MKTPWEKIKTEYINGVETMREIAERYGINPQGVMKRANREQWLAERQKLAAQVITKALDKSVNSRVKLLQEYNAKDVAISNAIKSKAATMLKAQDLTPSQLRQLAAAFADAQKIGRLALGLSTDNSELNIVDDDKAANVRASLFNKLFSQS
jgi:replicative superfamily II helicase